MSEITELLNNEIYPAIFDKANIIFSEHDFKSDSKGWHSQTYLDGKKHSDRRDKTVIRKSAIGYITEWGGDSLTYWDYVQKRDGLDNQQTLIKLAEMASITLPSNLSPEQLEAIRKANQLAKIWEDANTFFINCLSDRDNQFAKSERAEKLRKYFVNERRYTVSDIRLPESKPGTTLEVGFIPSQSSLFDYLIKEKKHDDTLVYNLVKLNSSIGDKHTLTIPYRDPVGKIRGFAFRAIITASPKYVYSTGLKKDDILFGLTSKKEDKDLVIVEGILDAGIATARGIKNVVALGGSSINEGQIRQAIKYGAKRFTLALDNDEAGAKATLKAIEQLAEFGLPVYVVEYPEGIKDADELINKSGAEPFQKLIDQAKRHFFYTLILTLQKYDLNVIEGEVYSKQVDAITEYVSAESSQLNPIDNDIFLDEFLRLVRDIPGLGGINKETLEAKAEQLRYDKDRSRQAKELTSLLTTAQESVKKGETIKAIDLIENDIRTIKLTDSISEFKSFLATDQSEEAIRKRLQEAPSGIKTGYTVFIDGHDEDVEVPAGVLSFVAAPTNHGKTAFLINVGLNIVMNKDYAKNNIYLLTFEESADKIMAYCLNAFINEELNAGVKQRNTILDYLKTGNAKWIRNDIWETFKRKKSSFFIEFIQTKRFNVQYLNYDSDKVIAFIHYIKSVDPSAVILIDYIQKMRRTIKGSIPARQAELKLICEDMETCANLTGLPIILGAQFNRDVVSPQDMHPTKMAEASDIEKTASEIIGLWNCSKEALNDKGGKTTKQQDAEFKYSYKLGDKEMILQILKSRSMPTGNYSKFPFNGKTGRIDTQTTYAYKPQVSLDNAGF